MSGMSSINDTLHKLQVQLGHPVHCNKTLILLPGAFGMAYHLTMKIYNIGVISFFLAYLASTSKAMKVPLGHRLL